MSNQNLIERYVREVGRNLPRRMRADVELELRSLLADSLDEQKPENLDQAILDLLHELGPPAEFAAQYLPERKLIGSRLFPLFKLVVTIVLSVMGGLHLVLPVIGVVQGSVPPSFPEIIWAIFRQVLSFAQSAIYVFGIITLIFAILEWLDIADVSETVETWDPLELPEAEDHDQLKPFELIFSIVGTILLIIAINFPLNWLGLFDFAEEEWGITVLLADGFYQHIPWLTALWIGEISLKVFVLRRGRWQTLSRSVELLLQIFAAYVLYSIWKGPEIFVPEAVDLVAKWIVLVVVVITAIDSVSKLYGLITRPSDIKILSGKVAY